MVVVVVVVAVAVAAVVIVVALVVVFAVFPETVQTMVSMNKRLRPPLLQPCSGLGG